MPFLHNAIVLGGVYLAPEVPPLRNVDPVNVYTPPAEDRIYAAPSEDRVVTIDKP